MNLISDKPVVIVPIGIFAHPLLRQVIDKEAIDKILGQFKAWGRDIVVDYQHESMKECSRAVAAGWVKTKNASATRHGIEAPIEWTDEAKRLIEARKYRFLSPVFESVNGKIERLINLGLTNNPNIHSMKPLVNQLEIKEKSMNLLTKIKELLGLSIKADEQEAMKAMETLITENKNALTLSSALAESVALLGLTPEASDEDIIARIEELAAGSVISHDASVERLVNDAVSAGKVLPHQHQWARNLAETDPESFRVFLINSGPALPLGPVITSCDRKSQGLSESEGRVCRLLNVNEQDYRKYGN